MTQKEFAHLLKDVVSESASIGEDLLFTLFNARTPYGRRLIRERHIDLEHYQAILNQQEKRRMNQALYRMKQNEKVRVERQGNKIILELEKAGEIDLLKRRIAENQEKLPVGHQCCVSFDIPEDVSLVRRKLSRLLREVGFRRRHQSYWYSEFDVAKDLAQLLSLLHFKDWVFVVSGRTIQP